jgi:tRNA A-37 threonylcarbamoyl transferase component Bud32/CheY-like chemotaxis protein
LLDHAVLLGLINRFQAREVQAEAEDREIESVSRVLLRKGLLTSWQLERVKKGDNTGFFYGGCKVLFHLAEGTFARVYRGMKSESGEPFAVKVLRKRFANDPEAVARFNKEAQEGMRLRHPNIVQIVDFGNVERQHYMLMEYVEGSNLRDLLKIRQRIDPAVGLPMMLGLSRGLKYALEQGVTHRDIKGSNILVSTSGVAKLVDFGLATIESEGKKAASVNPRTVDYSALERTCGSEKGDPRSDIFFLGCVFYQMLTGQLAMTETETKDMLAKMLKRSFGAIKPLSELRYAPDPELCRIIEKMMKVELKARYQKVDEVIADLEAYEQRMKSGAEAAVADEFGLDNESIFVNTLRNEPKPESAASVIATAPTAQAKNGAGAAAQAGPPPKNVLCVESQEVVQDAFKKTLSKMGYKVLLVGDPERAAERCREQPPDAVIFDADGLGPEAVDTFVAIHEQAHEEGHNLAALVLLGPRQLPLKEKLPSGDRLVVLAKPIKMKQVQDAITQLLPVS